MRIPVFARRANPAIDPPILRKSRFYAEQQVAEGRADWIDYNDPRKGIMCRELLHFGTRETPKEGTTGNLDFDWAELPGIKFVPPKMEQNPTLPRLEVASLTESAPRWDWSCETTA
jgi:hypothetical protein